MNYPSYYRFPNGKTYICLLSHNQYEEVRLLAGKASVHLFVANDFSMRNHLADLHTYAHEGILPACTEKEYLEAKNQTG